MARERVAISAEKFQESTSLLITYSMLAHEMEYPANKRRFCNCLLVVSPA